jgi:hypothetical protein
VGGSPFRASSPLQAPHGSETRNRNQENPQQALTGVLPGLGTAVLAPERVIVDLRRDPPAAVKPYLNSLDCSGRVPYRSVGIVGLPLGDKLGTPLGVGVRTRVMLQV